jgi:hypothetical protein
VKTRIRHYWRKRLSSDAARPLATSACDAPATLAMLSRQPQAALSWFDRFIAFLTTPFKRLGISGWKETGCTGTGRGKPVRDAQHSTDGFWTIDVAVDELSIGSTPADTTPQRYLRLEVEPDTAAHEICAATPILAGTHLSFGGAIVIDTDADFLEIHPDQDFRIGV